MPRNTTNYDLLISCPGDIIEEIDIIKKCVDEFNRYNGTINNVFIQTRHWSKDSFPQSGGKPQKLLNQQFINNCDAVVALFWTRFGTPTDKYQSGTEEEIDEMIKAGKQVFLYFCDKPITPSQVNNSQFKKVNAFKKKYVGLYSEYKTIEQFERNFSNHLFMYFIKQVSKKQIEIHEKTRFDNIIKEKQNLNILSDYYEFNDIKPIVSYGIPDDLKIEKTNNGFKLEINISDNEKLGKQEFVMALLKYTPSEDMSAFWRNNYWIEFDLETSLGLSAIQLEIKDENKNKIVDKKLTSIHGKSVQKHQLSNLTRSDIMWKNISEICFTIFLNKNYLVGIKEYLYISNFMMNPKQ